MHSRSESIQTQCLLGNDFAVSSTLIICSMVRGSSQMSRYRPSPGLVLIATDTESKDCPKRTSCFAVSLIVLQQCEESTRGLLFAHTRPLGFKFIEYVLDTEHISLASTNTESFRRPRAFERSRRSVTHVQAVVEGDITSEHHCKVFHSVGQGRSILAHHIISLLLRKTRRYSLRQHVVCKTSDHLYIVLMFRRRSCLGP